MSTVPNLFDRFGGIRPMAEALHERPSTVQSWKATGRIPATKQPDVLKHAERLGLDVIAIDVVFPLARRPLEVSRVIRHHVMNDAIVTVACDRTAPLHRRRVA